MKSTSHQLLVKLIAASFVLTAFATTILIADMLIARKIKKSIPSVVGYLPSPLQIASSENKTSIYGQYIDEGSFTSEIIQEHRHHDASDYTHKSKKLDSDNLVWILGDSWGDGLKEHEAKEQTISKNIRQSHSLRIIGAASFSPLLMNLAYRARVEKTNRTPDTVVIFIDQTDIGDDYCRYRPYVLRSKSGRLAGVSRNNTLELRGGAALNTHYKVLNDWNSGFGYLIKTKLNSWLTSSMGAPGITDCQYDDIMAFQKGELLSPNGSKTLDYSTYFKSNVENFTDEIISDNPNTNIILISHDWAQHSLKESNPNYLSNNISSILKEFNNNNQVSHFHLKTSDYLPSLDIKDIYNYPEDRFSHLKNYSTLSRFIADKINLINEQHR